MDYIKDNPNYVEDRREEIKVAAGMRASDRKVPGYQSEN